MLILTVDYHSADLTARMVESLTRLRRFDKTLLVIVRNGFDSGVAKSTQLHCQSTENVWLHNCTTNRGYFGGAKQGLQWFQEARGDLPPWIIVCNNDIRFEQTDFLERLRQLDASKVGVIAPRILSCRTGLNQNPFMVRRPGRWRVSELRFWLKNYYLAFLHEKLSQWKRTGMHLRKRFSERKLGGPGSLSGAIYAPHGSFLIFSNEFFKRGGFLDDGSFLYHEEISVAEICRSIGLPIMYHSELCVLHDEHSTTGPRFNRTIYKQQKQSFEYLSANYLADLVR